MPRFTISSLCLFTYYCASLLLTSFASSNTVAESTVKTDSQWQALVQMDNDIFTGSDRNYTNGIRFSMVKELSPEADFDRFLQKQLYKLSGADESTSYFRWRLRNRDNLRFASGIGITQLMFTPDDPEALSAPTGQRPYAGWLGLEFSLHAKNKHQVSSVTISLGTTGNSSFADEAQAWVHENISDSPIYQGWDSQVPNQVTLNFHFDLKKRIDSLDRASIGPIQFDGYYEVGAALGNFRTNAYGGTLLRLGYNLPATHSTPRVQLGSYGHDLFSAADPEYKPFSIYLFTGIRGIAVAHDITLDGPLFKNFDTAVESKTVVGESISGFGLRYRWVDLSYSFTIRSDEFIGQANSQSFGSIMMRFHSLF